MTRNEEGGKKGGGPEGRRMRRGVKGEKLSTLFFIHARFVLLFTNMLTTHANHCPHIHNHRVEFL